MKRPKKKPVKKKAKKAVRLPKKRRRQAANSISTQFKEGNQLWKLRSKHGRDKIFATPDILWDAASEYFTWCDDNPFMKAEAKVTKGAVKIIGIPHKRPYTLHGLCTFLHVHTTYFRDFKKANTGADFSQVIQQIEEIIYNQKFSGAAAGFFNANIIARDLGLKEQTENQTTLNVPDLTPEQRQKFREGFDNKF